MVAGGQGGEVRLDRLRIGHLRSLMQVDIEPGPRLNIFVGPNGAGKTSVLEAVFLLSRGRSFRSGGADMLATYGSDQFNIHGALDDGRGVRHRLGIGRRGARWQVQIDGESRASRSELAEYCPAVCFEPGSHALISAGSEGRRRFVDWGVFHVEHDFLSEWRRYRRGLQQRNSLLRRSVGDCELAPWEIEMAAAAAAIDQHRAAYLRRFAAVLREETACLVPSLGAATLRYQRGWDAEQALDAALVASRPRDRLRGHSTVGAHRADWGIVFAHAPEREHLSRGQEKLTVLACVLTQARLYGEKNGVWPIVCLDDLGSELDVDHRQALVRRVLDSGAQVWVTGTEVASGVDVASSCLFHVEHGQVRVARRPL